MALLRSLLPALALWLTQAGQTHARAQGYVGAQHPFEREPVFNPSHSFGHSLPISPDGSSIPHFEIVGHPEILSDRVILTPPHPGNQRAAIWSDHSSPSSDWELHVPFRASGGERAGGSLQIWYTYRGASATGTSTIYTAKPFEGLALVIDSQSGHGSIRGFLNDGTTDYSIHHHPQSLAFGQCDVVYRNLGRPSDLKVVYKAGSGLKVVFDDHLCFETNKVTLPQGYRFGVSAASAENPDSFEVFALKLVDESETHRDKAQQHDSNEHQRRRENQHKEAAEHHARMGHEQMKAEKPKYEYSDEDVKAFKNADAQFTDLHLRMQALTHQLAEVQRVTGEIADRVGQVVDLISDIHGDGEYRHGLSLKSLDDKLHDIEQVARGLERTMHHEGRKIDQIRDHHENMPNHLKEAITTHGPRMGFSVSLLIVFQVMLVISYVVYKRRRSMAPKKYL
ncbi:hypothetical protein DRE_03795 [Drechslerella stenobrocha 248]|uniref:L-type lectin-like domain-containing protein n=1 Tax=Drechslerella stenobrocha 248 TaxID=1043628 RepID=W7I4D5_9PEZI|nr:hypothetical protein DRE_03795 [Drechslerella stenobrocha 248]